MRLHLGRLDLLHHSPVTGTAWHIAPRHSNKPRSKLLSAVPSTATTLDSELAPLNAPPSDLTMKGANAQPKARKADTNVPTTFPAALLTFLRHPSVVVALCAIGACCYLRICSGPLQLVDAAVLLTAAGAWVVQEWAIHKYLLHAQFDWLGKSIHEAHHMEPYHHISIDGPEIVGPFMALAAGIFWLVLHKAGTAVVASACIGYFVAGLLSYQLVHFLVHTRWVPSSTYMRRVRQNHMLHHLRNHDNWFAFSMPQMDKWMGTCPDTPGSVPLKTVSKATPPMDGSTVTGGSIHLN